MKHITVVTPCYNEEENVEAVYTETKRIFETIPEVTYDHLFIDNASFDQTVPILRGIAAQDANVSVIVNARNFGHIKSPVYGLMQAKGDAVILLVADLQDPPELMRDFVRNWLEGAPIVVGVKPEAKESALFFALSARITGWLRALQTSSSFKISPASGYTTARLSRSSGKSTIRTPTSEV